MEYEAGNFDQGRTYLDRFWEAVRLNSPGPTIPYAITAMIIPVVARISDVIYRFDIAEGAADAVLSSPSAAHSVVVRTRIGLALMSVQRGDVSAAGQQYAHLEAQRGTTVSPIVIDRVLGLLSQVMGNLDQAVIHFEDARSFCRKGGYRPELAWTCCDYADALLQRNEPGDREKATFLLDESLAISTELGMRPLMGRVISRKEIPIA